MERYDLLVIGSGSAGSAAAQICRQKGWSVAIADKRPFGGTCSLRGCNPKRLMAGVAEVAERSRLLATKGIKEPASVDWEAMMHFKHHMTSGIPQFNEKLFKKLLIDTVHGSASFLSENRVKVGDREIEAQNIVIATGSKPAALTIEGSEHIITSDQFLELERFPSSVVFIGGGYISFEFAHIAAMAGAKVYVVESAARPLIAFDQDIVKLFIDACQSFGIEVLPNTSVESIVKGRQGEYVVSLENSTIECGLVVHGAGRVPETDELQLKNARIETDKGGIITNTFLQSKTNRSVYIAGDVNPRGIKLTTVAAMEGRTAAYNMLYGNTTIPDYSAVASIVFSFPQIASAGLTEREAQEQGIDYQVVFQNTSKKHITRRLGMSHSAYKLLLDSNGHHLLGAHLLGYNCDEVINCFLLAIKSHVGVKALKDMNWSFPSVTYDSIQRI
ncbi:NAD(P)/FAD-dependent oxidoreductase [Chitinispirillales bacterium ANBcel5]|uniref:dihydrolipoyl dehydrogenase family protein n=1 Tax=Cellulosispirillum alkaliphilum TaxID=3039283 RepID=UPI002A52D749|nr:NAD(P)/FAD-dependent oxidoreductase [Chitinispirillales bacterium ANBcel5]